MLFSEMDQKLLIEWTYKGEFAGLIFILETLTVLKTQLNVDFPYQMLIDLDFSLVTFDVGSMVLDFDFFTNLLNGFGLPQGVIDATIAVWNANDFASFWKINIE